MSVVIGTAGHIDHGKTTLLRALTGSDADRLPEERRRGLTIDLGYVHGSPDGGPEIDFVDVPGHDRLVGNMLVGVGEIDAALLVVAADDGPRAQTWEHLGLLDAMGIERGLIAITKTDLVDEDRVSMVVTEVSRLAAATSLADASPVAVSATTGEGLDELRARLAALRDVVAGATDGVSQTRARLALDRAFSVRGHGVVVTGSARGEPARVGETVRLRPGGQRLRVRAIQVHDDPVDRAPRAGRVAVNLAGAGLGSLRRGQVLTPLDEARDPLAVTETDRLLVVLRAPAALPGRPADDRWPPPDGPRLRLHIGTDQIDSRVGRRGRERVSLADDRAIAMLHLDRPIATAIGDPFALRRPPPAGLLAGGMVLDPAPLRGRSRRRQTPEALSVLAHAVGSHDEASILEALLALHGWLDRPTGLQLAADVAAAATDALLGSVLEHHRIHPEEPGLPLAAARAATESALRAQLSADRSTLAAGAVIAVSASLDDGRLIRDGDRLRCSDQEPPPRDVETDAAMQRLEERLDVAAPPALGSTAAEVGCPPSGVRELERTGRVVLVDADLAWSAAAWARLRDEAVELADRGPLTPAALRDATGTSRKYVMALLEDLDRRGILRRTSAGHVRGPRA